MIVVAAAAAAAFLALALVLLVIIGYNIAVADIYAAVYRKYSCHTRSLYHRCHRQQQQ